MQRCRCQHTSASDPRHLESSLLQGADKRDGPNYFVMVNDFRGMAALLRKLEDKIKQLADSAPRHARSLEMRLTQHATNLSGASWLTGDKGQHILLS